MFEGSVAQLAHGIASNFPHPPRRRANDSQMKKRPPLGILRYIAIINAGGHRETGGQNKTRLKQTRRVTHLSGTVTVIAFACCSSPSPKRAAPSRCPSPLPWRCRRSLTSLKTCLHGRPDILRLIQETSYSFPDAMIKVSLYTMLIIMIFRFVKSRRSGWRCPSLRRAGGR